ncbi:hypothetical protein X943_000613 [Babesia divergens]|uniref:Eukaryotic translation initiation factor 2A n=1 Tax=Babesia divergens TaxID=32595 RepID=A0AAD9LGW4_BABDI|nr:hypothetical protein X943_000613 [Babesia divergens]
MSEVSNSLETLTLRPSERTDRDWYILAHGKTTQFYRFTPHSGDTSDRCTLLWEESNIAQCYTSNSGHQLCIYRSGSTVVEVIDISTRKSVISIALPHGSTLSGAVFSPKDSYLVIHSTWSEDNPNNLVIYKLNGTTAEVALSIPYPKSYIVKRYPLWTPCETYCVIRVDNSIILWKNDDFSLDGSLGKLQLADGVDATPLFPTSSIISLSSVNKKGICYLGIFLPNQKKFDSGIVKIYNIANLQTPVYDKLLNHTEEGDFFWNCNGSGVIVRTFTNNVKGLSSYYGGNGLYLVNLTKGNHRTLMDPSEGLAHDISWSKTSNGVLIVKGSMPSELDLYDGITGNKTLTFGRANRNTIRRDPFDRFMLSAGFGNSSGEIDIWDLKNNRKIAQSKSDCAVSCEFSPDGRFFVTATTVPRMRVNNCFKVFSYGGKLVKQVDFVELFSVKLLALDCSYTQRDPSPGACTMLPTVTKSVYRPPGSRGKESTVGITRVAMQNLQAMPVPRKSGPVLKGPPGADLSLLNAAAKIGKKKKAQLKNASV